MPAPDASRRPIPVLLLAGTAWAVATLAFHASVDYLGGGGRDLGGAALAFGGGALAIAIVATSPRTSLLRWRDVLEPRVAWALLLGGFLYVHLRGIRIPALWLDEAYWIEQAKQILNGSRFDPAGFIGDQPANFQAWPVALLLFVTRDTTLAVRLPAVLYQGASALLLARLLRPLAGTAGAFLAAFFAGISVWSVHLAIHGWNNVTIAPVLVSAQLAFLVEALTARCERSLLLFGVAAGLAISTLYVPLLLTGLLLPAACLGVRRLAPRAFVRLAVVVALIVAPTVGKAVRYPAQALGRHVAFAKGGEHPAEGVPGSAFARYRETASELLAELTPSAARDEERMKRPMLWPVFLELPALAFLFVGAVALLRGFPRKEGPVLLLLLLAPLWTFGLLVASNPGTSVWRQAALQPLLVVVAAYGAARTSRALLPPAPLAVALGVAVLQTVAFVPLYRAYARARFLDRETTVEEVAGGLVPEAGRLGSTGATLALPESLVPALVQAGLLREPPIVEYRGTEALAGLLAEPHGAMAIGVVPFVQEDAQAVTKWLDREGSPAKRASQVRTSDGGSIGWFYLVRPSRPADGSPAPPIPGARLPELREPRGVALLENGEALVADFGNSRIARIGTDLRLQGSWGGPGGAPGRFRAPCGVAVGPDGRVFVADTWNHRVQVLAVDGRFLAQWQAGFFGPRGIAVAADGRVLVSDTGGSRIVVLDPEGKQLATWGEPGSGPRALDGPVGLAVDAEGRAFVADNGNGRIQVFERDGTLVSSFPVEGWRNAPFSEPGLALDGSGSVWASVPLAGEVRLYSADGEVRRRLRTGSPPGLSLGRPTGLAFRARDRHLLVSDLDEGLLSIPVGAAP